MAKKKSVSRKSVSKKKEIKKIKKGILTKPGINWTSEMSVNEKTIDNQHKMLLGKFNEILKETNSNDVGVVRGIINFLGKYSLEHFEYEEKYMKKFNYPGFSQHKKIHQKFSSFFNNYAKRFETAYKSKKIDSDMLKKFSNEAKKYLAQWLIHHIMTEDHKYSVYIEKLNNKNEVKEKSNSKHKISNKTSSNIKIDFSKIKQEVSEQLKTQRAPIEKISQINLKKKKIEGYIQTDVPGFDSIFEHGLPKKNTVLVAGGAGSGKTIFCLQTLYNHALKGNKCFYMSFEESEDKLKEHMALFGWDYKKVKDKFRIQRMNPFDITRDVDAMLAKQKGELLIDIDPILIPKDFKPDFIVVDSLTAISSAFTGKEDSYRIYIEQLFRFFEKLGSTTFLITETEQVPKIYSTTGVEEFLADGVIVLYNIKRGDVRENAIEVLKMRGEKHQKKIVAMQITDKGIIVYPDQEVFGEVGE